MGQVVDFPVNGETGSGYFAMPRAGRGIGMGPGLIVIQEWWGLVDHIKDLCERFAEQGFVALAPDLYHGQTTTSPDEAGKMMMALRIDEAEKEISAAIQYLLHHNAVTSKKIGIIGFCMGGALSLYTATKNPNVGACVVFYGGHPNVKPDLPNLQSPVLGIYGESDKSVPPEAVHNLEQQLQSLGKQVEMIIYPNAGHAFFNDSRPTVYNAQAAEDAWQRTIEFLKKYQG
jgi:carboxymethylenebutenolidase